MDLEQKLPGLVPGRDYWNWFMFFVVYLGFFFISVPLAVGYWLMKNGASRRLRILPGLSRDGGLVTGVLGMGYFVIGATFVLSLPFSALLSVAGSGVDTADQASQSSQTVLTDGGVDADSVESATPTPSPTTVPTESQSATATASPTASATPSSTPTATPSPTPTPDRPGTLATIVEVVDGDTVKIRYENGTRDTARLLGVDTPEVHVANSPDEFEGVPNNDAGADCLGRWGDEASSYVTSELLGEQVRITFDENEPRRGYYDRLLVYIHHDGSLFNRQLVSQGYARVYSDSQFTKKSVFLDVEDNAQSTLTGLWECQNVETATPTPTDAQGSGGNVMIETIHYDAAGDEYDNLNDEYVVLKNTGDAAVDVGGWTLSDEADHTYTIPSGVTLDAGESITIHTGSGSNSESDLYWGQGAPVWNNGGDTATLRNNAGEEEDSYQYDG